MRSRALSAMAAVLVAGTFGLGAVTAAGAAGAAAAVKPRAGSWSGQEANGTTPSPVSFTVGARGQAVTKFSGEAIVKASCTNHIRGFSAPTGPMTIAKGRFHGAETSYPQRGVRVTVTGTFTTRTKAHGHIMIHFKHVAGCDANRAFTARRATG